MVAKNLYISDSKLLTCGSSGLLEVVKIASNRGFDRVVFESDSQILVNAIYLNVVPIKFWGQVC
jgi:hypothetical protein